MTFVDIGLISKFDKDSQKHDLHFAAKELLNNLGIKVNVDFEIPDGPLLIISNHPGSVDSFVSQAAINKKSYFVALEQHRVLGKAHVDYMVPIYRQRRFFDFFLRNFLENYIPQYDDLTLEELQIKNRASISKAADLVNQNQTVVIFPTGRAGKNIKGKKWKAGVGYLVKQISNPKAQIIFMNIQGSAKLDVVRFLNPKIRNLLFKKKRVEVKFSKPENISKYCDLKPKDIAMSLEENYDSISF